MNYFNYFSEIEEAFVRRRGKNLLLSPLDWALIEAWKERGIPLQIAVRAIETVFDTADAQPQARRAAIKSLTYCRDEVERQFAAWTALQTGNQLQQTAENQTTAVQINSVETVSQSSNPNEQILSHLQLVCRRLQANDAGLNHNWNTISTKILSQIRNVQKEFSGSHDLEKLESILNEIDSELDEALLESYPTQKLLELKNETIAQLRSYKNRMTPEAYEQTFRTLLLKTLRERVELPRLGLFYL